MKTATEILEIAYAGIRLDLHQNEIDKIITAMESYAQMKVNELNKSDVIKSVCEHIAMYTNPKDVTGFNSCIKCGIRL